MGSDDDEGFLKLKEHRIKWPLSKMPPKIFNFEDYNVVSIATLIMEHMLYLQNIYV